MTMGEKLIALRKREGWSQEELSERLDVSRQSVSKWEGGLAFPATDKLLELSRLFNVSTDYLLKDELESPEPDVPAEDAPAPLRQVSAEEAETFLDLKEASASVYARAVAMCILSPVCLLLLSGLADIGRIGQHVAVGIGMVALFALVTPAVAIFVTWGMKLERYEYMEKEVFAAGPGAEALARSRMEALDPSHTRRMTVGICLCVAAAVPVCACAIARSLIEPLFMMGGVGLLLVMVAAGVYQIVLVSIPWDGCQMVLQEGDYTPENKNPRLRALAGIYWCVVTAGYLLWSFVSDRWDRTWLVWPVAGVLFGALAAAQVFLRRRK